MEVELAVPRSRPAVEGVGRSAKNSESKGTTMKKSSQIQSVDASAPAIPEGAAWRWERSPRTFGGLAMAVGAGLQVT